ncbi:MAG: glucosylceramidase, partial [Adhaeribacter sp.]|nr:glucosylceramidase [Adhaeribacter sp.]
MQTRPKPGFFYLLSYFAFLLIISSCQKGGDNGQNISSIEFWLTKPDKSVLFAKQDTALAFDTSTNAHPVIQVDEKQIYQEIDGFGYTLTGGSALLISQMGAPERTALLQELFGTEGNNIGISYLRVSIGASDLDSYVFTYNDLPAGQTDPTLDKFSLAPDRAHLIPVLKQILTINPDIKILGSPWSPPAWMKTNNHS